MEAAEATRIGRLVHLPTHGRIGRLYQVRERRRLHPEVTWRSESEYESAEPRARRRRRSRR